MSDLKTHDSIITVTCPRCGKEHASYHRIILGKTYEVCENCMSVEERGVQDKNFRNWLERRYKGIILNQDNN